MQHLPLGKSEQLTTLQTFVEKGIIHAIATADNSVRYALCKDCEEGHHHDEHVHFVCSNYHKTICLDDVVSPNIDYLQATKRRMCRL